MENVNEKKKLRELFRLLQEKSNVEIIEWSVDVIPNAKELFHLCKKSSESSRFKQVQDLQEYIDRLLSGESNGWVLRSREEKVLGICIFRKWIPFRIQRNQMIKQDLKSTTKQEAESFKENFRLLDKQKKLNQFSSSSIKINDFEDSCLELQLICVNEKAKKQDPNLLSLLITRTLFEIDLSIVKIRKPFSSASPDSIDFVAIKTLTKEDEETIKSLGFQPIQLFEDKAHQIPLKWFKPSIIEKLKQILSKKAIKTKTPSEIYLEIFSKEPQELEQLLKSSSSEAWKELVYQIKNLKGEDFTSVEQDIISNQKPIMYKSFPFFSPSCMESLGFKVHQELKDFHHSLLVGTQNQIVSQSSSKEILSTPEKLKPTKPEVKQESNVKRISFVRTQVEEMIKEIKLEEKELNLVSKRIKECTFEEAKRLETAINDDIQTKDVETSAILTVSTLKIDRVKVYAFVDFISYRYRSLIGKYNGLLQQLQRDVKTDENDEKIIKYKKQIDSLNNGFKASERVLLRWLRHTKVIDHIYPESEFYLLDSSLKESIKKLALTKLDKALQEESLSDDDGKERVFETNKVEKEMDQLSIDARYSIIKNIILNKLKSFQHKDSSELVERYIQPIKSGKEKVLLEQRQQLQNEFITRQNDLRQYASLKPLIHNPFFIKLFEQTILQKTMNSMFEKMTQVLIKDLFDLWDFGCKIAFSFQTRFAMEEKTIQENPFIIESTLTFFVHRFLLKQEPDSINYWYKLSESIKELKNSKRDSIRNVESKQTFIVDKIVYWILSSLSELGIELSFSRFVITNPNKPFTDFVQQFKNSTSWKKDLETNFSLFLENNTQFSLNYMDADGWIQQVSSNLLKRIPEPRFKSWFYQGCSIITEILTTYKYLLKEILLDSLEFEILSRLDSDSFKNQSLQYSETLYKKLKKSWSRFFGINVELPKELLHLFDDPNLFKQWKQNTNQFSFDSTFTSQIESKDSFQSIKKLFNHKIIPSPMITCSLIREHSLSQYLKTQMNFEFLYHWPERLIRSFYYFGNKRESYVIKRGIPDATFEVDTSLVESEDMNQFPFWNMMTDYQNVETRLFFRMPQVTFSLKKKQDIKGKGFLCFEDLGILDTLSNNECYLSPRITLLLSSFFDLGFKNPFDGANMKYDSIRSFFAEFFPDFDLLESSIRRSSNDKEMNDSFDSLQHFLCQKFDQWKRLPLIYEENKVNTIDLITDCFTNDGTFVSNGIHYHPVNEKTSVKFSKENENFVWIFGDDFYSRISGTKTDGFLDKKLSSYLGFVSYKCDVWPRDQKKRTTLNKPQFSKSGLLIEPKTKNSYNKTLYDPYPKAGHLWHLEIEPTPKAKKVWFKQEKNGKSWKGFITSVIEFDSFFQPISTSNTSSESFSSQAENPTFFSGKIPYLPIVPAIFKTIIESFFQLKEKGFQSSTILLVRLNRIKRLGLLPENVLVYILRKYFDFALCLSSKDQVFTSINDKPYEIDMNVKNQWRVYTTIQRNQNGEVVDIDRWEEIDDKEPFLIRPIPSLDEFWRLIQYYLFYFFEHQTRNFEKTNLNDIPSLFDFLTADKDIKLSNLSTVGPVHNTGFDRSLFTNQYLEKLKADKNVIPKHSNQTFLTTKLNVHCSLNACDLETVISSSRNSALSLHSWLDENLDPWILSKYNPTLKKLKTYLPESFHPFFNLVFYSDFYLDQDSINDYKTDVKKDTKKQEEESYLKAVLIGAKEFRLYSEEEKEMKFFQLPISSERSNISIWLWKELNKVEKVELIRLSQTFENKNYKQYLIKLYRKYDPLKQKIHRPFKSIPFSKITNPTVISFISIIEQYVRKHPSLVPNFKAWDSMILNHETNPFIMDSKRVLMQIEQGWKQIDKRFSSKITFTKEQQQLQDKSLSQICNSILSEFAKSLFIYINKELDWIIHSSKTQPNRLDWNGSKSMQQHRKTVSELPFQQSDFVKNCVFWQSLYILDVLLIDPLISTLSFKDALDFLNKIACTFNLGQRPIVITTLPNRPILFDIIPHKDKKLFSKYQNERTNKPNLSLKEQHLTDLGIFTNEPKVDNNRGRKYDSINLEEIDVGSLDSNVEKTQVFYSKNSSFYRLIYSGTWRKDGFFTKKQEPMRLHLQTNSDVNLTKKQAKEKLSEIWNQLNFDPSKESQIECLEEISVHLEDNSNILRQMRFPFSYNPEYNKLYKTLQLLELIASQ